MTKDLVFLHGFLGTSSDFQSLDALKKTFNCTAIDLNSSPSFAIQAQANHVFNELKKRNISRSHFWGYSMGGRILLELYRSHPEICESLVLESTSPGVVDEKDRKARLQSDYDWAELIKENPSEFLERWYSQKIFANVSYERNVKPHHAQMIVEASPGKSPHHWDLINNIKVPTLALVGRNDAKYIEMWGKMIDKNPHIAIKVIENSGHAIHLDNPQSAVDCFQGFIQRQEEKL